MPFFNTRSSDILQRAVRAAVASHRPTALRALLVSHGVRAFAKGLCGLSGRVIADALTMLAAPDRIRVQGHLPRAARKRLRDLDGFPVRATHPARSIRPFFVRPSAAHDSAIRAAAPGA